MSATSPRRIRKQPKRTTRRKMRQFQIRNDKIGGSSLLRRYTTRYS